MMFKKKSGLRIAGMMLLAAVLTFCPSDTVKTVYATQTSQTQGSDAYLKTFSATPGTMSPDFSSMVTNYTITVSSDVDQLSVTCSTADANAQVTEAKGFKNLQLGNNKATIKVKGASGTICTYNFTIVKGNMSAATNPAEGAGITLATGKSSQTSGTTTSGTKIQHKAQPILRQLIQKIQHQKLQTVLMIHRMHPQRMGRMKL